MIRVLFVCMGNICRSPTAEGVFRKRISEHRLDGLVDVASAGTHAYHVGQAPDQRAQRAAASRGYDLSSLRARKVAPKDFEYFDFVLAMDRENLESLRLACPVKHHDRRGLLRDYAKSFNEDEVPDPYYGSGRGFDRVLDMVEDATQGLLEVIKERSRAA